MPLPLTYNIRNLKIRWHSSLTSVISIALVVAIFIIILSMSSGIEKALSITGSPDNAIVRRDGSTTEMDSVLDREQASIISSLPDIAKGVDGKPLASSEVVVLADLKKKTTGTPFNVTVRGLRTIGFSVRNNIKIIKGRIFKEGLHEFVAGRNIPGRFADCEVGSKIKIGKNYWTIVGIFDSGGSGFDSQLWGDLELIMKEYYWPSYQSVTFKMSNPAKFKQIKEKLESDPRLEVTVDREQDFFRSQSEVVTSLIHVLGFLITIIMSVGAVFSTLNTMYASVSSRIREVATMIALGFTPFSVAISFITESIILSLIGGLLGCLFSLPANGYSTGTMNFQTFSDLAFKFTITPKILAYGLIFSAIMGILSGILPAVKAARLPCAATLREF
jgi:putative ABC transport system permease protein